LTSLLVVCVCLSLTVEHVYAHLYMSSALQYTFIFVQIALSCQILFSLEIFRLYILVLQILLVNFNTRFVCAS